MTADGAAEATTAEGTNKTLRRAKSRITSHDGGHWLAAESATAAKGSVRAGTEIAKPARLGA